nr:MAG TPA: hypothetical protein [Caudoviricetes sp.]
MLYHLLNYYKQLLFLLLPYLNLYILILDFLLIVQQLLLY